MQRVLTGGANKGDASVDMNRAVTTQRRKVCYDQDDDDCVVYADVLLLIGSQNWSTHGRRCQKDCARHTASFETRLIASKRQKMKTINTIYHFSLEILLLFLIGCLLFLQFSSLIFLFVN